MKITTISWLLTFKVFWKKSQKDHLVSGKRCVLYCAAQKENDIVNTNYLKPLNGVKTYSCLPAFSYFKCKINIFFVFTKRTSLTISATKSKKNKKDSNLSHDKTLRHWKWTSLRAIHKMRIKARLGTIQSFIIRLGRLLKEQYVTQLLELARL